MSNYIDPYNPIFYAQEALIQLENALGMSGRVHRGYDDERKSANVGDVIRVKKPGSFSTQAGGTGTASDLNPTYVDVTVDTWREVKFALTDQELSKAGQSIVTDHIAPAAYAVANYIETTLTGLYKFVPWSYNMSTTIVATDIVGARKILRDNAGALIDTELIHFGIDSTLEAAFLGLSLFHDASVAGQDSNLARMRGHLGERFGIEHFVQQTLASHTSGTVVSAGTDLLGSLAADGDIRATTVSIENLSGVETFAAGDSFVIAGNTQRYVVTTATTLAGGANASVPIYPGLVQDYTAGDVVTFETKSASNFSDKFYYSLMFHRNAFALVMAPLPEIGDGAGARMSVVTNPKTGLSIRSRLAYDDAPAKVIVTLDALYGVRCLDPNLAVVVRRDY